LNLKESHTPTSSRGPSAHSNGKSLRRIVWAVLLVALIAKIAIVFAFGERYNYHSDDRGYLASAHILLETGIFTYNDPTQPTLFITPGYPVFIAGMMKLFGTGFGVEQAIRIAQAIMIAIALWVLFRIGERLFSAKTAAAAVIAATCYPPLWLVSNFIFTESLFTLLAVLLVDAAIRLNDKPTVFKAVGFGLLWAAAVYIRPTIALWPGVLFLYLLWRRELPWAKLLRTGLVTGLVVILCMLPWWIRNYDVSGGQWIPLTQSSGNPLLLGSFPYQLPTAEFIAEQGKGHTNDLRHNDELDTERAKERIAQGFREQFFLFASWYTVGKFAMFWGDVFYWMPLPGIPLALAIAVHYVLAIAGFVGIFRNWRNREAMMIVTLLAYMTMLHLIYLAHSRYSMPLMPFMALFAAAAFCHKKVLPISRFPSKIGVSEK